MHKKIIGNPTTTPLARPDLDSKVDKVDGKGLSSNDFTDNDKENVRAIGRLTDLDTTNTESIVGAINEVYNNMVDYSLIAHSVDEIYDEWEEIPNIQLTKELINPTPITEPPTTLETNKQYNFGERKSLSLAFPTQANDGDVIYLTFKSGATPTALTIDTTNTCDIECIPEANTGYEIFGKYNGSIWIINYSEYTVSEG